VRSPNDVGPDAPSFEAVAVRRVGASSALIIIALIAGTIAMIAPFDLIFEALTFNSPILRATLIVAMAVIGAACARRLGLRLQGHGTRHPALVGLLAALLVAVYIVILDAFVFRSLLAKDYVEIIGRPLFGRYIYFMTRAFNENVIYRLFAFSGLVMLVSVAASGRKLPFAIVVLLMIVAQVVNIGANVVLVSEQVLTFAVLFYDVLRYIVPGVIWACLFWRYGFFTAEVASVSCHVFLQPALGYLVP